VSQASGYTIKQLLYDISYEFLQALIEANIKLVTRQYYREVAAPRLSNEELERMSNAFEQTFGEPVEIIPEKQMTLKDLESQMAQLGITVKIKRK